MHFCNLNHLLAFFTIYRNCDNLKNKFPSFHHERFFAGDFFDIYFFALFLTIFEYFKLFLIHQCSINII
jgi:hypothetical protein